MRWLKSLIRRFWNAELETTVTTLAAKYLSEYGLRDVRMEHGGVQCAVVLDHCEITFWHYKMDVGSAIRPLSGDDSIRYASEEVAEVMVRHGPVHDEVDRQMRVILRDYSRVLAGHLDGWPVEDN